jgi:hypothetical protein
MILTQTCAAPGGRKTPSLQAVLHYESHQVRFVPAFPQAVARKSVRMRIDTVENASRSSQFIYVSSLNF